MTSQITLLITEVILYRWFLPSFPLEGCQGTPGPCVEPPGSLFRGQQKGQVYIETRASNSVRGKTHHFSWTGTLGRYEHDTSLTKIFLAFPDPKFLCFVVVVFRLWNSDKIPFLLQPWVKKPSVKKNMWKSSLVRKHQSYNCLKVSLLFTNLFHVLADGMYTRLFSWFWFYLS